MEGGGWGFDPPARRLKYGSPLVSIAWLPPAPLNRIASRRDPVVASPADEVVVAGQRHTTARRREALGPLCVSSSIQKLAVTTASSISNQSDLDTMPRPRCALLKRSGR